ncbi:hypothetical protein DF044_24110 [Burkholderia contaminans]|nr:hypothetical protein [Burkholderia contaminans]RQT09547.1 hypothetical protein DF044_24110 [Burkholderia contaminans]
MLLLELASCVNLKAQVGEYAPSLATLRRWVKQGHISPRPQKVGLKYFARREAEFIDTTEIRVRRMVGRYKG